MTAGDGRGDTAGKQRLILQLAKPTGGFEDALSDGAGALQTAGGAAGSGLTDAELRAAAVEVEGEVSLAPATLAALETIGLDAATLAALENVTVGGTVALDAPTLAALETISVASFPVTQPVSGTVALDAPTLAALETIGLDAASLAALENIVVSGTIELGATSLAALESITAVGPLTDVQLRATPVPVSGTVEIGATSLAALENVTIDGGTIAATQSGYWVLDGSDGLQTLPVSVTLRNGLTHLIVRDPEVTELLSRILLELIQLNEKGLHD